MVFLVILPVFFLIVIIGMMMVGVVCICSMIQVYFRHLIVKLLQIIQTTLLSQTSLKFYPQAVRIVNDFQIFFGQLNVVGERIWVAIDKSAEKVRVEADQGAFLNGVTLLF